MHKPQKKDSQPAGSGLSNGESNEGWVHPDSVTKCPMKGGSTQCESSMQQGIGIHLSIQPMKQRRKGKHGQFSKMEESDRET